MGGFLLPFPHLSSLFDETRDPFFFEILFREKRRKASFGRKIAQAKAGACNQANLPVIK